MTLHPITHKKLTAKQAALLEIAAKGEPVRIPLGVTPANGVTCGRRHFPRMTFNTLAALFGKGEIEWKGTHANAAVYRLAPEYRTA